MKRGPSIRVLQHYILHLKNTLSRYKIQFNIMHHWPQRNFKIWHRFLAFRQNWNKSFEICTNFLINWQVTYTYTISLHIIFQAGFRKCYFVKRKPQRHVKVIQNTRISICCKNRIRNITSSSYHFLPSVHHFLLGSSSISPSQFMQVLRPCQKMPQKNLGLSGSHVSSRRSLLSPPLKYQQSFTLWPNSYILCGPRYVLFSSRITCKARKNIQPTTVFLLHKILGRSIFSQNNIMTTIYELLFFIRSLLAGQDLDNPCFISVNKCSDL